MNDAADWPCVTFELAAVGGDMLKEQLGNTRISTLVYGQQRWQRRRHATFLIQGQCNVLGQNPEFIPCYLTSLFGFWSKHSSVLALDSGKPSFIEICSCINNVNLFRKRAIIGARELDFFMDSMFDLFLARSPFQLSPTLRSNLWNFARMLSKLNDLQLNTLWYSWESSWTPLTVSTVHWPSCSFPHLPCKDEPHFEITWVNLPEFAH